MPYPSTTLYPSTSLFPGSGVPEPLEAPGRPALTTRGAVEKLQPGRYMLRHIAPEALDEPGSFFATPDETAPGIFKPAGTGYQVLRQLLYADPLPQLRLPTSPDWHEGSYTLRVLDSGEFSISFPNRDASDGQPWRRRFETDGHTQFIEISREAEVEFVGVIVKKVMDRGKVTLTGYDGMFLLKKAFEQDYTTVMAPRDLIERYTSLSTLVFGSDFPFGAQGGFMGENKTREILNKTALLVTGPTSEMIGPFEEGTIAAEASGAGSVAAVRTLGPGTPQGRPFTCSATFTITKGTGANFGNGVGLQMISSVGEPNEYDVILEAQQTGANSYSLKGFVVLSGGGIPVNVEIPATNAFLGTHTALIEGDGIWAKLYWDGVLVAVVPHPGAGANYHAQWFVSSAAASSCNAKLRGLFVRERAPFLMRGSEKGQYVLPGGVSAYPTGGLHARYHPYSGPYLIYQAMAPDPRIPGFPQFKETQEPCNITEPGKAVGLAASGLCMRMFGSIYLPLSKGNVTLQMNRSGAGVGVRVWVGKTTLNQQVIESYNTTSGENPSGVVNAASLGGVDGWYPIIIEAAWSVERGIALIIVPNGTYTDPGGTELKVGVGAVVPGTSLSPIGCVDTRIQGSSFFDIISETAKEWGLQFMCAPRQLESGAFPGQIIPTERLGRDTDEIIEAGDIDRRSEFNNYTSTEDATDIASSIKAFGSGIADGKGSQVAFEAIDVAAEEAALFDLQAWLSAGDIAFPQLLAARANAELGLRSEPWTNVEGEPIARDRLADSFPLTGVVSAFRWQPGDGVRLRLADVDVEDLVPRQILQITRNFSPDGRTGTSIGFRARPKDPVHVLRKALREATRSPRAYQRAYTTRSSEHVGSNNAGVANNAFTSWMIVPLDPQEKVIAATAFLTLVSAGGKVGIEIGTGGFAATNRTAALGGPWSFAIPIDISAYAAGVNAVSDHRLYARFKNETGAEINIEGQLVVTILV